MLGGHKLRNHTTSPLSLAMALASGAVPSRVIVGIILFGCAIGAALLLASRFTG
jgi:hypothetical protein